MKTQHRQLLVILAATVIGATILYGVVKAAILMPAAGLDAEIATVEKQIRGDGNALGMSPRAIALLLEDPNRYDGNALEREWQVAHRLTELSHRAFSSDEGDASESVRELLMGMLAPSGLTGQFRSTSVEGKQIPKSRDRVVSRTINITGAKLDHAINFLYLLAEEPRLHRFDTLRLNPSVDRGKVDLTFQYSTLVLAMPKVPATSASAPRPATQLAMPSLDDEKRGYYQIIEERDIFRPYQKRPPPPPPDIPVAAGPSQPPPPPPPPPSRNAPEDERWRVSSLSMIDGTDVVHVRHVQSGETRTFKIGQPLMTTEGKIVMVDTRTLRRYDNPKTVSDGRVIYQVKDTFWAVENGDALAQKRRLAPAELPPQLLAPASAPAAGLSRKEDAKLGAGL